VGSNSSFGEGDGVHDPLVLADALDPTFGEEKGGEGPA